MITTTGISTQARSTNGNVRYRFRNSKEINQAISEVMTSRRAQTPILTGTRGIPATEPTPDEVAEQMQYIQKLYNKERGVRIREEMISISADELDPERAKDQIEQIALRFSDFYFDQGHQNVYGVYQNTVDGQLQYDILYAINTVNFQDGSKYIRNSNEYAVSLQQAAETVVSDVVGTPLEKNKRFNFESLEYAN